MSEPQVPLAIKPMCLTGKEEINGDPVVVVYNRRKLHRENGDADRTPLQTDLPAETAAATTSRGGWESIKVKASI